MLDTRLWIVEINYARTEQADSGHNIPKAMCLVNVGVNALPNKVLIHNQLVRKCAKIRHEPLANRLQPVRHRRCLHIQFHLL